MPKYQQIAQTLGEQISAGRYARSQLPGERELAQAFGVARVTIRSALKQLVDTGKIVRLQAQGPLVPAGEFGTMPKRLRQERVDKFLDRGRDDMRKVLAYGRVSAPPHVASALAVMPGAEVLRVVRLRADAQSRLTYTVVHIIAVHAGAMTRAALARKAMMQLLMDAGVRLGAADQTIEAEQAPTDIARALHVPVHHPVLRLTRIVKDDKGQPIQLFEGWYRADRFAIRMMMSPAEDATTVWVEQRPATPDRHQL